MSLSLEHSHSDKQTTTLPSCSMFELSTVGCVRAFRIKFKFLMEMETQNFSYWCWQSIYVALLEQRSLRVILLEGDAPYGRSSSLDTWSGEPAVGRVTS